MFVDDQKKRVSLVVENLSQCKEAVQLHSNISETMYNSMPKEVGGWNPMLSLESSLLRIGATGITSGIFYCSLVELGDHSVLRFFEDGAYQVFNFFVFLCFK